MPTTPRAAANHTGQHPREMSFNDFLALMPSGTTPDAETAKKATVKLERRGQRAGCRELEYLMLGSAVFFAVFLGAGALGLISVEPLTVKGARTSQVLMGLWSCGLGIVAAMLLQGVRRHQLKWMCRGARLGAVLWFAMWIAVILPGVPVMAWGFCPLMIVIHTRVYLMLCTDC